MFLVLVTVILHLPFKGKHVTKRELMQNSELCMSSVFKKKLLMIDAVLAVDTALVYQKKKLLTEQRSHEGLTHAGTQRGRAAFQVSSECERQTDDCP